MKKIFSILAVITVMTVFASCSNSATKSENDTCNDSVECVSNDSCNTVDSTAVDADTLK